MHTFSKRMHKKLKSRSLSCFCIFRFHFDFSSVAGGAMYCITADAKETGNEGEGNGDGGTITAAHIADAVLKKNTEIQNLIFFQGNPALSVEVVEETVSLAVLRRSHVEVFNSKYQYLRSLEIPYCDL